MIKYMTVIMGAAIGMSGAVMAEDDPLEFDGYISVATDHRDRGVSLSGSDPALTGSLTVSKGSFFAGAFGAWAKDLNGRETQTEFFAGYILPLGGWDLTLSGELDSFHGNGSSSFYPEVKASLSRDYGLAYVSGGLSWSMNGRWNNPYNDSTYTWLDVDVPIPSLPEYTIIGHIGHDFIDGNSNVTDWSIGMSAFIKDFEVSASYVDTTYKDSRGKGAFLASLKFYF
jgi:uncharacterized protein (TIGR02001 family)